MIYIVIVVQQARIVGSRFSTQVHWVSLKRHLLNVMVVVEKNINLTHLCLASHKVTLAKSVDSDQTPLSAASDQGLHRLH